MNSEEMSIVERELGLLDTHYGMLRRVAQETIEALGEEAIGYWVDAYSTCTFSSPIASTMKRFEYLPGETNNCTPSSVSAATFKR